MKNKIKKLYNQNKKVIIILAIITLFYVGFAISDILNANAGNLIAKEIKYDQTRVNLGADNVQDAIANIYKRFTGASIPQSYLVTFNCNGCENTPTSQNIVSGGTVTKPTDPTKSRYEFKGWYTDSTLTNAYVFTTPVTSNITLYAKWELLPIAPGTGMLTVTFNTNGGSNISSISVDLGVPVTKPTDPTKEGYTFAGWYSDSALTNAYVFTTPITEDITLYAKWTQNQNEEEPTESENTTFTKDGIRVIIPTSVKDEKGIADIKVKILEDDERQQIEQVFSNLLNLYAVDIQFVDSSQNEIDMGDQNVTYEIPLPTGFNATDNIDVLSEHEEIEFKIENGYIKFTTKGTGPFMIVKTKENGENTNTNTNGEETTIKKNSVVVIIKKEIVEKKKIKDINIEELSDEQEEKIKKIIKNAEKVIGMKINLVDEDDNIVDLTGQEITYKVKIPPEFNDTDIIKLYRVDGNAVEEIYFTKENGDAVFKVKGTGTYVFAKISNENTNTSNNTTSVYSWQTGQKIIRWGIIILSLSVTIIILMILKKQKK